MAEENYTICPRCHGKGLKQDQSVCDFCHGSGQIPVHDTPDDSRKSR